MWVNFSKMHFLATKKDLYLIITRFIVIGHLFMCTNWIRLLPSSNQSTVKAMPQHFQPNSRHKMYTAKLQTRRKRKTKIWAGFGDYFCALADKVFPKLVARDSNLLCINT